MRMLKSNPTSRLSQAGLIGLAILSLPLLTTAANASCFDHGRGTSPALPSGLIAQLAASPSAASGTITGLWHATYTTSDNQVFQESFDMWHSDGTELESANINPVAGNFCMGVWKQIGSEIRLHHVGWGFDNLGNLVGPFTVDQTDVLGPHGNPYSGNWELKLYDTNGNLLQEVTGTISATRIGAN
jgi:hypothetical protein